MTEATAPTSMGLNTLDSIVASQDQVKAYEAKKPATRLLMIDIETLSLLNRPVVTEVCLMGYDLEDDEFLTPVHHQFYDIDPQLAILPPRSIQGSTIAYRMKESDSVRANMELCAGTDFEDLVATTRGFVRTFEQLSDQGEANYIFMSARPQFDINAMGTLIHELGLTVPWAYDSIVDLRSLQRELGIHHKNTALPVGAIPHTADGDVRWQIEQYLDVRRKLAGMA